MLIYIHIEFEINPAEVAIKKVKSIVDACNLLFLTTTDGIPSLKYLDISADNLSYVNTCRLIKTSLQFCTLLKKENAKLPDKIWLLDDLFKNVVCNCLQAYRQWCVQISEATLNFNQVDIFLKLTENDLRVIQDELNIAYRFLGNFSISWISERIEQLKIYIDIKKCEMAANATLKVKKWYELSGSFESVELLQQISTSKMQLLKDVTKNIVDSGKALQSITNEQITLMEVFCDCKKLVKWLKINVSSAREVKSLVDLAMTTAVSDLDVHKVSSLHAAAIGFSPLIYDLLIDANFDKFIQLLKKVGSSFENDKDLCRKLVDVNNELNWLQGLKKSFGSAELAAYEMVEDINKLGVYTVGNQEGNLVLNPLKYINLTLERFNNECLKFDAIKLQELQSKLMLVAGSADEAKSETVKKYVKTFDGLLRLANILVSLRKSGNLLFSDCTFTFFEKPNGPNNVSVDFGLKGSMLFGSEETNLHDHIISLCNQLEDCFAEWTEHINEKRREYPTLNHFSTQQLLELRNKFALLCSSKNLVDRQLSNLLSLLVECSENDIVKAVNDASNELNDKMESCEFDEKINDDNLMECVEDEDDSKLNHIRKLLEEENRFSEQLIDKSILFVKGIKDCTIDDALDFCMKHSEEDMMDDKNFSENDIRIILQENEGYSEKLIHNAILSVKYVVDKEEAIDLALTFCMDNIDTEFSDMLDDMEITEDKGFDFMEASEIHGQQISKHNFLKKATNLKVKKDKLILKLNKQQQAKKSQLCVLIKNFWKSFLKNVRYSNDYISLDHLGFILMKLSETETQLESVNYDTPGFLTEGQPNLIVCEKAKIWKSLLTLYLADYNTELPKASQILLCNENTQSEEIELLYRRAAKNSNKLFAILNADALSYEASEKADKVYDEMQSLGEGKKMKLVVYCVSENEDKCRIVSSLDRFRINNNVYRVLPDDILMKKLQEKLVVNDENSATRFDPQKVSSRLITSLQAGNGKTLYIDSLKRNLKEEFTMSIMLHFNRLDVDYVVDYFYKHVDKPNQNNPRIFHLDVTNLTQTDLDDVLFSLLILGSLSDNNGRVWKKSKQHLYLIECMEFGLERYHILNLLPRITCFSPTTSLNKYKAKEIIDETTQQLMNINELNTDVWKRPYSYIDRYINNQPIDMIIKECTPQQCLETLIPNCGISDPSWAELRHFAAFLNAQLKDCEQSGFCSAAAAGDLPGFLNFTIKFMLRMSMDFATRSLVIAEQTPNKMETEEDLIQQMAIKRHWEHSPHPYLFFNIDGVSFTFLGFKVDKRSGDLIDPSTNQIIDQAVMTRDLYHALSVNRVKLDEDFENISRNNKLLKMHSVLIQHDSNSSDYYDPKELDNTYELTTDNVLKILAIHMRLRCGIPVIIMGETGCGKTRLIKFYSELLKPTRLRGKKNRILMKVHGGVTVDDIQKAVDDSLKIAKENVKDNIDTLLFFDEANTTEAIYAIKEIMCDKSLRGIKLECDKYRLRIIAACNPYKKHKEDIIKKLEQAGLGYHVSSENTRDKLGGIPLRQLVYRVQALPPSMLPFVWDFGQLSIDVEKKYIKQIVNRNVELPPGFLDVVVHVLSKSQDFMREESSECSFVSLRDVERCILVMSWFLEQSEILFPLIDIKFNKDGTYDDDDDDDDDDDERIQKFKWDSQVESFLLALGVCYYCGLRKSRQKYLNLIGSLLNRHIPNEMEPDNAIYKLIEFCQEVFLDGLDLKNVDKYKNSPIARNSALRENVWMMVICIELRIPLFVVGKPGSSKSLAKCKVEEALQHDQAYTDFYKKLKLVHMMSYQCSPLSTADGIVETFSRCSKLQQDKNLDEYCAVVVLDEIGLAEDSPLMPLKALHALLDDGSMSDEIAENYKKVGFIGISNWALDPAKMNRGVLMQCADFDKEQLILTAKGICENAKGRFNSMLEHVDALAEGYMDLCQEAREKHREFFGLRDFYSLIKMIYLFCSESKKPPSWKQIEHCIYRNLSGMGDLCPVKSFKNKINLDNCSDSVLNEPDNKPLELLRAAMIGNGLGADSRYVLVITENYAALDLMKRHLDLDKAHVIFGSSFRKDQQYTQLCLNINRIKVCMELGKPVILLNLESIYESLYDALNQYYSYFGGKRFVDLGLGFHRIKCQVHETFRLFVVAERKDVYEKYPIPLINRLEKHELTVLTLLSDEQKMVVNMLKEWLKKFCSVNIFTVDRTTIKQSDVFIGYQSDSIATLVLDAFTKLKTKNDDSDEINESIINYVKKRLIMVSTPESIVKLENSKLSDEIAFIQHEYESQAHNSLPEALIRWETKRLLQITTHSRLLTREDLYSMKLNGYNLQMLHAFETEHDFDSMLKNSADETTCLILQSDATNEQLIACARYKLLEYKQRYKNIIFIIRVARRSTNFTGVQGSNWTCLHIDDLKPPRVKASLDALKSKSVAQLFNIRNDGDGDAEYIDRDAILFICIPEAMSILRDEKGPSRTNWRLNFMRNILKNNKEIRDIFMIKVGKLLINREESISVRNNSKWLSNNAASIGDVTKAGTFARSWLLYIQERVTKALACVIAFADTNHNLNLLENNQQSWIEIFRDEKFVELNFMRLTDNLKNPDEIHVKTTAYKNFKPKLPFSWLLFDKVKGLCDMLSNSEIDKETVDKKNLDSLLLKEPIFNLIRKSNGTNFENNYYHDAICLLHKPICDNFLDEWNLIYKAVNVILMNNNANNKTIIDIHLIYSENEQIFKLACSALKFNQDLLQTLLEDDDKKLIDNKCQSVLHIRAVECVLKNFDTLKKKLNDIQERSSWLRHVKDCRPAIENIFYHFINDNDELIVKCKRIWTSVCIVEMFIEHVCPVHLELSDIGVQRIVPLWMLLRNVSSMNDGEALVKLRKFLLSINGTAMNEIFKKNVPKCGMPNCVNLITGKLLVCGHKLCEGCELDQQKLDNAKCPQCKKQLKFTIKKDEKFLKAQKKLIAYKRRCNSFFMGIVSRYCFNGEVTPSCETIDLLLSCVTCKSKLNEIIRTKDTSIFDDCIDPTPILRSFVLQQLLKYDQENILFKLDEHFMQFKEIKQNNSLLASLVIYCIEDSVLLKTKNLTKRQLNNKCIELAKPYANIIQQENMSYRDRPTDIMLAIGNVRYCLCYAVNIINEFFTIKNNNQYLDIIKLCSEICNGKNEMPKKYLLKHFYSKFGLNGILKIPSEKELQWLIPSGTFPEDMHPDIFTIYGEEYKTLRDAFDARFKPKKILNLIKNNNNYLLYFALFSTISASKLKRLLEDYGKNLIDLKTVCDTSLWKRLVQNKLANFLDFYCLTDDQEINDIVGLLFHCEVVLKNITKNYIAIPLRNILEHPNNLQNSYLPTMPDDVLQKIKDDVKRLGAEKGDTMTAYICPNGHPYFIGNCGNPVASAICSECKTPIGGFDRGGYQLQANNERLNLTNDRTELGYLYGPAKSCPKKDIGERGQSALSTGIIRSFLHLSMLLAANNDYQIVQQALKLRKNENVFEFLYNHLKRDISLISKELATNRESTILLLHCVLKRLLQENRSNNNFNWDTTEKREEWEMYFLNNCIQPAINNDRINAEKTITKDNRLSSNKFLTSFLQEDNDTQTCSNEMMAYDNQVWRHRDIINVEMTIQRFQSVQQNELGLLKVFFEKLPIFEVLQCLPDIIKLQHVIVNTLRGKIIRSELSSWTFSEFLNMYSCEIGRNDLEKYFKSFQIAWNICKGKLHKIPINGIVLERKILSLNLHENSPLEYLLPSNKGYGMVSMSLVFFLIKEQNDMLTYFENRTNMYLRSVCVDKHLSVNDVIKIDIENQLHSIVLSISSYELDVIENKMNVNYDWFALQRSIIEQCIEGKPKLELRQCPMLICKDSINRVAFNSLEKLNIQYEQFSDTIANQIVSECFEIDRVYESLMTIKIVAGFLNTIDLTNRPRDEKLIHFIKSELKLESQLHSHTARQHCTINHIRDLWLIISREYDKLLINKDLFEIESPKINDKLRDDLITQMKNKPAVINILINHLHRVIHQYTDNDILKQPLKDVLMEYFFDIEQHMPDVVNNWSNEILVENALDVWQELYNMR